MAACDTPTKKSHWLENIFFIDQKTLQTQAGHILLCGLSTCGVATYFNISTNSKNILQNVHWESCQLEYGNIQVVR